MNEDIKRVVTLKSQPSAPDGTFSQGETDDGFKFVMVEKPWADNKPDLSCIPRSSRYPARWQWSPKHNTFLYHILEVPNRTAIEWHSANVHWQLLGCGAPGARIDMFAKDSIAPGMPPVDARGVIASANTLIMFHQAMRNKVTKEQDPFWLEIS